MAKQKKNNATGYCKFCGQQLLVYLPEGWDPEDKTQEEYDQLATEQCECEQALTHEEKNQKKLAAIKRMTEYYDELLGQFRINNPETVKEMQKLEGQQALMLKAVEMVADRVVHAAAVQLSLSEAFTVAIKASGDIQIKRTYKGVEEWVF